MTNTIEVYTISRCLANPGPGGYAVVIDQSGRTQHLAGRDTNTNPHRLRLLAIAEALRAIPKGTTATLHLDSPLLVKLLTSGWPQRLKERGWLGPNGRQTPNRDLWKEILQASKGKFLSWTHPAPNQHAVKCRAAAAIQAQKARSDLEEIQSANC